MGKINTVQISGISYSIEDSEATKAVSGKQDTLISGTNIKTINNESILGSGNIDIQGGGVNVVQTTGTSTADVMSQDAVSTQLNNKANKSSAVGGYQFGSNGNGVYLQYKNVNSSNIGNALYYPKINGKEILTTNSFYAKNNYNFQLVATSAITTSVTSSSTDAQVPSAKAVYDALQEGGGGGGSSYTAGDGIDITNDVISVTGKADTSAVTAIQDSLSGYVTTDTEQIISGRKIFTYSAGSSKAIEFKQTDDTSKVGFRVRTSAASNNELASFEFRPNTFTVDGVQHPLMYFGHYRNTNTANAGVPQTVIGFRQYDQSNAAAYHYLMPLPEKAKTPFSLTTSFKDYYAPMGFKNGSTMITADDTGVVDLSSEFSGKVDTSTYNTLSGTVTAHTADTTIHVTSTEKATWNAKSDFSGSYNDLTNKLSAGTNITIVDNVISAEGGGKAVTGGTNISVTTGTTADTINCTLRAANTSGTGSMKLAYLSNTDATGVYSVATGYDCKAKGNYSFASGRGNNTNNYGECAVGFNNKSVGTSSSISKNSGCTLFSVGNGQGTRKSDLHNAFEVRQNGDIYITLNDQDVKLQDQLGGGGSSYSAGTGIDITNDIISVTGVVETSAVTSAVTSGSTDVITSGGVYDQLGGLKLVKLTQSAYDALSPNYDSNTLYVIVN